MARKGVFSDISKRFFPAGGSNSESETSPECFGSVLTREDLELIRGFFFILTEFEV